MAGTLLVQLALIYLPVLQPIFATRALSGPELAAVLVASTAAFLAVEGEKAVRRRTNRWPASA